MGDMQFLGSPPAYDLTYDDVFMVPQHSAVSSRLDVDLTTPDGLGTTIPIAVANMTAISGRRMAETIGRRGGLAVLPQDIPTSVVAEVVDWLKDRHLLYDTPITIAPDTTIGEALSLLHKRAHGGAVVVEGQRPVGILTERDCAGWDRFAQVGAAMSSHMITVEDSTDPAKIFDLLTDERVRIAPVVAGERLVGVTTRKGAVRAGLYQPALDEGGRLLTAAAIGVNGDVAGRAEMLLASGVDVLVIDTAHGFQQKMLDALSSVRAAVGSEQPLVAGNVVSAEARGR